VRTSVGSLSSSFGGGEFRGEGAAFPLMESSRFLESGAVNQRRIYRCRFRYVLIDTLEIEQRLNVSVLVSDREGTRRIGWTYFMVCSQC
jgi:hypothetical protein